LVGARGDSAHLDYLVDLASASVVPTRLSRLTRIVGHGGSSDVALGLMEALDEYRLTAVATGEGCDKAWRSSVQVVSSVDGRGMC
jgi:hypothetical protein